MRLIPLPGHGPEDVVIDAEGWIITGLEDGRILRVNPDTAEIRLLAHTGGRPLGLELFADGRLLICDSRLGLLEANPKTGEVKTLLHSIDGEPMRFCNNAAIAGDGTVYFTDSSRRYGIEHWRRDMVENIPTGRLLCRRPNGAVELLLDGLFFANGVALSTDESWVIVAETGCNRLTRVWLKGDKAGRAEVFFASLPGVPDNLSTGGDGLIWVALAAPSNALLAQVHKLPYLARRLVARLPEVLQPEPERTVWVLGLDGDGHVVHNCRLADEHYHMVTGVREHGGRLYMGSIEEEGILIVELADNPL
jgi:sugar lactone lactonase YvrE